MALPKKGFRKIKVNDFSYVYKVTGSDYGISFLLSVISSGIKAGVDQLYMDLGYIYFIPKGTVIDSELFIIVNN